MFTSACKQQSLVEKPDTYFFAGHIYDWNFRNKIDPRIVDLNLEKYDQVWLGGDLCGHTSEFPENLKYVDSILNVSHSNVHWALGNHDLLHGHLDWIASTTRRKSYYTKQINDICLLVLNTNLFFVYPDDPPQENCDLKEAQIALVNQVLDTISASSHLIILHHFGMFNELQLDDKQKPLRAFNINPDTIKVSCDPNLFLTDWLYPKLVEVQNRGIQVLTLGGDLGMAAKKLEYTSSEGIIMLGAGLNGSLDLSSGNPPEYVTNFDPDNVIIFKHYPQSRKLDWEFVLLDSL